MNCGHCMESMDHGAEPYVANVSRMAIQNQNFRSTIWTGRHLQMTLMSIRPGGEIGLEMHEQTDQLIQVEQGTALVKMGKCKRDPEFCQNVCKGDAIFVPAGTWHNVINTGSGCLKVSSVYAPPNHPKGTVHQTKADSDREED